MAGVKVSFFKILYNYSDKIIIDVADIITRHESATKPVTENNYLFNFNLCVVKIRTDA